MANLSFEEPDALMCARPDLWEPWRATAKATRPAEQEGCHPPHDMCLQKFYTFANPKQTGYNREKLSAIAYTSHCQHTLQQCVA